MKNQSKDVVIAHKGGIITRGVLNAPLRMRGVVIFSYVAEDRRQYQKIAELLNSYGIGTLIFNLLSDDEASNYTHRFDIPLLAERLMRATHWIKGNFGTTVPVGYFGISGGASAALWAAEEFKKEICAIVACGGRHDLALPKLKEITAPTLLIIGGNDTETVQFSETLTNHLQKGQISIIPQTTHLFEEEDAVSQIGEKTLQWFKEHLVTPLENFERVDYNSFNF